MRIENVVRTLLGTAGLCCLFFYAGCSSTTQESSRLTSPVDWGMSLLSGGAAGVGQFPAKFTFDVTAAPDCVKDFVVYNTGLAGASGTTANIVAFNELYSTQGGATGPLCGTNGPSVYWSYFTGTGSALTSVALSGDGTRVAFVENPATGGAILRLLKWSAGEGTGANSPDTVATGTSWAAAPCSTGSCVISITFSNGAQDTISEPFYDFTNDVLYVGDNNGAVHKFIDVFTGGATAPTEDTTNDGVTGGTAWPITVNLGATLTSPIYDSVSGNIYVGDSTGLLSFIRTTLSTVPSSGGCTPLPCLDAANFAVGTGGSIVDGPIVDSTNGFVFAVNGTETANFGTILQAPTSLASSVSFKIGGNHNGGVSAIYGGDFDNTYFTSSKPNIAGHMYVCGKDPGQRDQPAVYQLSFTAATGVLSGVGSTPLTGLSTSNNEACSPVTEFFNATASTDWIFFSIGNHANSVAPIPSGSACRTDNNGCVISINVTGSPTWPPTNANNAASLPANNAGAASGIVVDNVSASAQASSIYFSLGANSKGTGPGLPSCNTTKNVGCAVKLTQSGLQ
jgi:hypothetical protein